MTDMLGRKSSWSSKVSGCPPLYGTAEMQILEEEERRKLLPRKRMLNQQRRKTIQNGIRVVAHAHVTNSVQNMDKTLPGNTMWPGHVNPPKDRWRRNTTCNL